MATFDAYGRRLDLDPVPKEPTVEKVRRVDAMMRKFASPEAMAATSQAAAAAGFESIEEFNDYDVADDPIEPAGWEHPGDQTYDDPPAEPDPASAVSVVDPPPAGPPPGEPGPQGAQPPSTISHGVQVRLPDGRYMLLDDYLAART